MYTICKVQVMGDQAILNEAWPWSQWFQTQGCSATGLQIDFQTFLLAEWWWRFFYDAVSRITLFHQHFSCVKIHLPATCLLGLESLPSKGFRACLPKGFREATRLHNFLAMHWWPTLRKWTILQSSGPAAQPPHPNFQGAKQRNLVVMTSSHFQC